MSLPVVLRLEVKNDIEEIFEYLEQFGSGQRFVDRLSEKLHRIENDPELYGIVWKDVRAVRLRKFMYVMYYVVLADRVEVLAVLHGSRHESVWKSRT